MIRIPTPSWARPFVRDIDERFGDRNVELVLRQNEQILERVHQAVQEYIDDPKLTSEKPDDGFPCRSRLTGEYYIASEGYYVNDEPWFAAVGRDREYRVSIMTHCLERQLRPDLDDRDYLGLEVHFDWLPIEERVAFFGDVDSSSI